MTSCTITHCSSVYGGAAGYLSDGSSCTMTSCTIAHCGAYAGAGAMELDDSSASLWNTAIVNCSSAVQGGGIVLWGSELSLTDSSIVSCHASGNLFGGGAVLMDNSKDFPDNRASLTMTRVHVTDCHTKGSGGALFIAQKSAAILTDTSIVGCSASLDGGAVVMLASSTASLVRSRIINCSALSGSGGAMVVISSRAALIGTTIQKCRVEGFRAEAASYFVQVDRPILTQGGGIFAHGSRTLLQNGTSIVGCYAPGPGSVITGVAGSQFMAQLPAPPGRWIAGSECLVYRESCPSGKGVGDCLKVASQCAREANITARVDGVPCRPATRAQPCAARSIPSSYNHRAGPAAAQGALVLARAHGGLWTPRATL